MGPCQTAHQRHLLGLLKPRFEADAVLLSPLPVGDALDDAGELREEELRRDAILQAVEVARFTAFDDLRAKPQAHARSPADDGLLGPGGLAPPPVEGAMKHLFGDV